MSSRPRIKICGITRPKDARLALELGADYLGLNFFAGSSRGITVDQAKAIRQTVGERVPLIGVFVNHRAAEIDGIHAAKLARASRDAEGLCHTCCGGWIFSIFPSARSFWYSFQVMSGFPLGTSFMVMQFSTGQSSEHMLQPTQVS